IALYRWMLGDRIWARSHCKAAVKPCIANAPRMRVSSACLIALSLDPIVRRRCLTFSRGRDALGSYLDMFTISSCARLRSGMVLSSVKPCTTQCLVVLPLSPLLPRRHLLSSSTADYPALDSLLYGSPWRDPIAGFLMRWATLPLRTQRLLRALNYLDRWRHHPPLRSP
ncbi:hypothetical protein B0H14DRAFT_2889746, partial [Mycena olivaceomarginata]